mmetsp:Transcript_25382/g.80381  ORF Transcript_25382/g.80381 Transcript_25382/m.80381 type:complete len:242 (+) Transcript_25382:844-1569(+)
MRRAAEASSPDEMLRACLSEHRHLPGLLLPLCQLPKQRVHVFPVLLQDARRVVKAVVDHYHVCVLQDLCEVSCPVFAPPLLHPQRWRGGEGGQPSHAFDVLCFLGRFQDPPPDEQPIQCIPRGAPLLRWGCWGCWGCCSPPLPLLHPMPLRGAIPRPMQPARRGVQHLGIDGVPYEPPGAVRVQVRQVHHRLHPRYPLRHRVEGRPVAILFPLLAHPHPRLAAQDFGEYTGGGAVAEERVW